MIIGANVTRIYNTTATATSDPHINRALCLLYPLPLEVRNVLRE